MIPDFDGCYRVVQSRDARFDGWFFTAVTSTRIYCRPSCPAVTPKRHNLRFYPTAGAAQTAGFRACRRCRPDVTPGSPDWNARADVAGRAMRLISDGVVDREGVGGLAARLGYSERHLNRQLTTELGAGPLALARAQRAHTARLLIETTSLPFAHVAFASGFSSIRQFNDTVRLVFAATPTDLRRARHTNGDGTPGTLTVRLPYRAPLAAEPLLAFLGERAIPGVEAGTAQSYARSLALPHGDAVLRFSLERGAVHVTLRLDDLRDLATAIHRARRLLDLDADPIAVDDVLRTDPVLGAAVRRFPGVRVPGTVDGEELAARAVLGQMVSVATARSLAGHLVRTVGRPLTVPDGDITHVFPASEAIAAADPSGFRLPRSRAAALQALAAAMASGDIGLDEGADRDELERRLCALRGIGPWTAGYVALRALNHPDVFLPTDLGVARALASVASSPVDVAAIAERWRPWRSYALAHTWTTLPALAKEEP